MEPAVIFFSSLKTLIIFSKFKINSWVVVLFFTITREFLCPHGLFTVFYRLEQKLHKKWKRCGWRTAVDGRGKIDGAAFPGIMKQRKAAIELTGVPQNERWWFWAFFLWIFFALGPGLLIASKPVFIGYFPVLFVWSLGLFVVSLVLTYILGYKMTFTELPEDVSADKDNAGRGV